MSFLEFFDPFIEIMSGDFVKASFSLVLLTFAGFLFLQFRKAFLEMNKKSENTDYLLLKNEVKQTHKCVEKLILKVDTLTKDHVELKASISFIHGKLNNKEVKHE